MESCLTSKCSECHSGGVPCLTPGAPVSAAHVWLTPNTSPPALCSYGDILSLMGSGAAYGLTCINYPQLAWLLPSLFVPTLVPRWQLNPGEVYSFNMAPDWAAPAAANGKHAVSVADSSPISTALLADNLCRAASTQACAVSEKVPTQRCV